MTALAANRNTPEMAILAGADFAIRNLGMAAAAKIYEGSIVVTDAAGNAKSALTATTVTAVGVAVQFVDNTSGGAGAATINVKPGVFKFVNLGADLVVAADLGLNCYLVDDQTVAHSNGGSTRSVAGKVIQIDTDGVWVALGSACMLA